MAEEWNDQNMMSPPTEGGPMEERPSKWPTVVGVLGIVWASLGIFCGCVGFFAVPMQRWGLNMQAQAGQSNALAEAQLHAAEKFQIIMISLIAVSMVFAVTLLIGSISLVRRRRKARTLMMTWAMASLLMLAFNIALQVMTYQATVAELNNIGDTSQLGQLWVTTIIGGFVTAVFGFVPPLFVIFWFSRQRIKSEVEQWP